MSTVLSQCVNSAKTVMVGNLENMTSLTCLSLCGLLSMYMCIVIMLIWMTEDSRIIFSSIMRIVIMHDD